MLAAPKIMSFSQLPAVKKDTIFGAAQTNFRSYLFYDSFGKVEKILKGRLDSIPSPSPSAKIQIMGGKVCLRCKGKITFENKKFVDITQQCFAFTHQVNFPANNLNFH